MWFYDATIISKQLENTKFDGNFGNSIDTSIICIVLYMWDKPNFNRWEDLMGGFFLEKVHGLDRNQDLRDRTFCSIYDI